MQLPFLLQNYTFQHSPRRMCSALKRPAAVGGVSMETRRRNCLGKKSWSSGILRESAVAPEDRRPLDVIPVHKSGRKEEPGNYKLVSLTSAFLQNPGVYTIRSRGSAVDMARPVIPPMNVRATAPETFSVLQQRIDVAEEQAESLIQELGSLGVSTQSFQPLASDMPHPIRPYLIRSAFVQENDMLWKNCESLVSRVCRMESVLQTLKLCTFRLHTEKELSPKHSAQLEERLNALQEEHVQELKVVQLEVMRLHQKLREESEEKEMVQDEKERLSAALEIATTTKTDVAIAAEELRATRSRICLRLQEVEEQLSQERSFRMALETSQVALLQSVQDMEKVVESERKQVQVLQQDCQSLREEGQTFRDRLQTEEEKSRQLDEECMRLKSNLDAKDAIISQLQEEGKNTLSSFTKEHEENTRLRCELGSLREMAERVQALNDQLDRQCAEMGVLLRKVTLENAKLIVDHQANLKAEREDMAQKLQEQDLLLDAARANITSELQNAQRERLQLERELKSLYTQHTECKKRAGLVEEKLATQKELQESTIVQLEKSMETARQEGETLLREKEGLVKEMNKALSRTMEEKNNLEAELTENKLELTALKSALQTQEKENKCLLDRLAAQEHQQQAQQQVEQVLSELTDSKNKLAYEKGKLQNKVQQLEADLKSLADAHSESTQLRKLNTALETKYNQMNAELSSSRIQVQHLETQLKQAQSVLELKEDDFAMAIQSRNENLRECQRMRGLMEVVEEQDRQKISTLQRQLVDMKGDNSKVSILLENVLASHSTLQKTVEKLQTELGCKDSEISSLRRDRFQSQQRTQHLEAELEQCQARLHSAEAQQHSQVESLRRVLGICQEDNKKLALNLEQALKNNSSLQRKLSKVQDQLDSKEILQQQLGVCREQVAEEAKMEAKLFSERLESLKKQFHMERVAARKAAQRDLTEMKTALCEATSKSAELARANRELRQKVTELGKTVKNQQVKLKSQKKQIQQQLDAKASSGQNTERIKEIETELKQMELMKEEYQKKNYEQSQKIQKLIVEVTDLQNEMQKLAESQQEAVLQSREQESRLQAEKRERLELESRCQTLEDKVRHLKKLKEATEQKLKAASKESEQISANLEEAHRWFKTKFDSLQLELVRNQDCNKCMKHCEGCLMEDESKSSVVAPEEGTMDSVNEKPVKLPSHSSLNRWETKQELKLISWKYLTDLDKK